MLIIYSYTRVTDGSVVELLTPKKFCDLVEYYVGYMQHIRGGILYYVWSQK